MNPTHKFRVDDFPDTFYVGETWIFNPEELGLDESKDSPIGRAIVTEVDREAKTITVCPKQ